MWRRDIYYYDTSADFGAEQFAGRLLNMISGEMKRQKKKEVLFFCIGTDRSTGDSLGPLVGHKLQNTGVRVIGTLEQPVHALNMEESIDRMRRFCRDAVVVAVDASVGNPDHIGYVTLGRGSLKPGLGVRKNLEAVGDICITGIVGSSKSGDPLMLQSVRLSMVMQLADCISRGILLGMQVADASLREPVCR